MTEDGHPDPTGPDAADGPTAAHDGEERASNVARFPGAGQPLADRDEAAADPEEDEDGQQVFMVDEAGTVVRFSQLVRRDTPVEVLYTMTGRSLGAGKSGLIDPYKPSVLLLSDCVVDSVKTQYIRDEDQKIEGVKQYVTLKPRTSIPALSEAGGVMLREAAKARAA